MSLRDKIEKAKSQENSLSQKITAAKEDVKPPQLAQPVEVEKAKPSSLAQEIKTELANIVDPQKLEDAEDNILQRTSAGMEVSTGALEETAQRIKDKEEGLNLFKVLAAPTGQGYVALGSAFVTKILESKFGENLIAGLTGEKEIEGPVKYTPAALMHELGKKVPTSETVLKAAGMPGTVDLPLKVKYGPMIGQALEGVEKTTGIPMSKLPDRFVLGTFIDYLLLAGAGRVLSRMAASDTLKANPKRIREVIEEWQKASPELLNFMEREIAKQEQTVVKSAAKTGRGATKTELEKIKTQLADTLWEGLPADSGDVVVGSTRFRHTGGAWQTLKPASDMEKLKVAKQAVDESRAITAATENAAKAAIEAKVEMPPLGEADVANAKAGITQWLSSPRYAVPELYDLHMEKISTMSTIKAKYWKLLDRYKDIQNSPARTELIGKILDGVANHPEIEKSWMNLSTHEAEALQVFRQSWDELADMLYDVTAEASLKPGNRISTYLTHIVKKDMAQNKVIPPDRLQKMVDTGQRYLKKRTGTTEYSLNPFEAFEEYVNWASEKVADVAIKPRWEQTLATYDKSKASYGQWFWNNVHRISNYPAATKKAVTAVRDNIYRATLGWNLGASLVNRTQSFLFGSSRIGWGPFTRGIKLAQKAKDNTVEGQRLRNLIDTSGVFDDLSEMIVNKHFDKAASIGEKFSNQAMKWFSNSEKWNKSVVYLGAYEDTLSMINQVKGALGTFRGAEAKLQSLGVDWTRDAAEQAHKAAFKAVVDTQFDMSKSGQNYLASDPIRGLMTMYSSFPIKAAEYSLHTLKKASQKVLKDPWHFYQHPEVREATRFGINSAVLFTMLSAANVSPTSIVGPENLLPNVSPALKMVLRSWSTAQAVAENASSILSGQKSPAGLFDPNFQKDSYLSQKGKQTFMRDLSLVGLPGVFSAPGSAQAWKIFKFMRIVADNLDNKTGEWNIYDPKSGALKYKTSPLSVLKTLILPSQDEEHYFQQIKNDYNETRKQRNAGKIVQRMLMEGRLQEAAALAKEFGIRAKISRASRKRRKLTAEERRERMKRGKSRRKSK